jgi:hypothetical protein
MAAKNNGMKWRRRALAARSGQRASRCHNHRGIAWRREWRDGGGASPDGGGTGGNRVSGGKRRVRVIAPATLATSRRRVRALRVNERRA